MELGTKNDFADEDQQKTGLCAMLIVIASSVRLTVCIKEFEKCLKDCDEMLILRTYTKIYRQIPVSVKVTCKIMVTLHEDPRRVSASMSRETLQIQ